MTQALVLRTSSTGCEERRISSGYQRVAAGSRRPMRSPNCTSACWTGHVYCASLTLVGGRGWFSRLRSFAFSEEALITEFPEHVQEENPGDAQHDQDFEQAVHGGHRSGVDDPADPRERDKAEQN